MPPGQILRFEDYDDEVELDYRCECGHRNVLKLEGKELIKKRDEGDWTLAREDENFGRFSCGGCGYNRYFIIHKGCVFVGPPDSQVMYIQNHVF